MEALGSGSEHSPRCGLSKALILCLLADLECTRTRGLLDKLGRMIHSPETLWCPVYAIVVF